jgi:hypothetical protein
VSRASQLTKWDLYLCNCAFTAAVAVQTPDDASDSYDGLSDDALYEPVWRQLLQLHLKHQDPEVAQQAAASLAERRWVNRDSNTLGL